MMLRAIFLTLIALCHAMHMDYNGYEFDYDDYNFRKAEEEQRVKREVGHLEPSTIPSISFAKDLTPSKLLIFARQCQFMYSTSIRHSASYYTKELRRRNLIQQTDEVIAIIPRTENLVISAFIIKEGGYYNSFFIIFSGTRVGFLTGFTKDMANNLKVAPYTRNTFHLHPHSPDVKFHYGIDVLANNSFYANLQTVISKHIVKGESVWFQITGHSMGGGLAHLAHYYIKTTFQKALQDKFGIAPGQVHCQTVAFGPANVYAGKEVMKSADKYLGYWNMVNFWRHDDWAVELSQELNYSVPGINVIMTCPKEPGFHPLKAHNIDELVKAIESYEDHGLILFEKARQKALRK